MGYAKINGVIFNCYSYYPPGDSVVFNLLGARVDAIDEAIHAGPGTIELNGDYIVYGYSEPVSIKKTYEDLELTEVTLKKPDTETLTKRNAEDIAAINDAIVELAELIPDPLEAET